MKFIDELISSTSENLKVLHFSFPFLLSLTRFTQTTCLSFTYPLKNINIINSEVINNTFLSPNYLFSKHTFL